MKKIVNNEYQEEYYTKTLDNGLQVILFYKPNFHNNFFTLLTPYGAGDYRQKDQEGNQYHLPPGVAHFLEHRMFDYQGIDVMEKLVSLGASSNASTSYDMTQYYFGTTKDDFREPLALLLDFVFDLTIPPQTVEKEKGIIIEELNMYDNMPDFKLYFSILKGLYKHLPYNQDIGGSIESVSATTLEDLELAYKLNYHPSHMFLVGTVNNKVKETFKFIEDNFKDKEFPPFKKLERDFEDEPVSVVADYGESKMDINIPKVAVGYKFLHKYNIQRDVDKAEWLMRLYFEMLFSSVNEKYQDWLDEKIINDYFDIDVNVDKNTGHFIASGESRDVDSFILFVESVIKDSDKYLSEEKFNQIKNKYVGKSILAFEQPMTMALIYARNLANGSELFEGLDDLKNLKYSDLLQLLSEIKLLDNRSVYVIKSNDK
ncbi:MAG TPA: pitrilysin family protein [Erysipelotrichaceae bacterium]|nr:pitrilysin family protein [Erysipelotrichaceae bacterium]